MPFDRPNKLEVLYRGAEDGKAGDGFGSAGFGWRRRWW